MMMCAGLISRSLPGVIDACRMPRRARFWLPVVLALGLGSCAAPTFEERLSYLEVLKSRGTITEEEYAIMRRRLVEAVDVATLRASPELSAPSTEPSASPAHSVDVATLRTPPEPSASSTETERPPEPLSAEWMVGSWSGNHTGSESWHQWDVLTIVEFSLAGDRLEWRMTRRFRGLRGIAVAKASGTAVVREDRLEMT